jgi:hypothetical protein
VARSGTRELPTGPQNTRQPGQWYPVCGIGDLGDVAPVSRTVRVRVSKSSYSDPLYQASLPAGVWWAPDEEFTSWTGANYCGVLRFTYGASGMQRVVYCDLRSGEYQFPACAFLRVDATRYTPAANVGGEFPFTVDETPYQVEAEIGDGYTSDYTPMLLTAPSEFSGSVDPGDFVKVAAPPGAYAFEIYPRQAADLNNRFETRTPASVRDFADGVWLPPSSPLPLVEAYVEVACDQPLIRDCSLVFFIR